MTPLSILGLPDSMRRKLQPARLRAARSRPEGADRDCRPARVPLFNGDLEEKAIQSRTPTSSSVPLQRRLMANQEYNHGVPGDERTRDGPSRRRAARFGASGRIIGASPGITGAARARES